MTMRLSLLAAAILAANLAGCQGQAPDVGPATTPTTTATANSPQDAKFADLSKRWLDGWLRLNPIYATQVGDHRFDGDIDDLSTAGRQKALDFSKKMLAELDGIDASGLARENQVDALILRNQLRSDIWHIETLQDWAWDPQDYAGLAGSAIYGLMARDFAPMPQRLKMATARMEKIPAIFAQARRNLDPARVPRIHADTVASQNKGVLDLIDQFIVPQAGQLQGQDRERLDAAVASLRKAVAEHQAWLDSTLVPNAKGDFRIGRKLYDEKLQFALMSSLPRAEIKQRAQTEIARLRGEMYVIAQDLLRGKPGAPPMPAMPDEEQQQEAIEAALELTYAERPARDSVVEVAKQTLAEATAFTRAKDLVTVPDDPVKIILMPEFQRGFSVAYCDSPGPLDKGLDTYYAISPIPDDWSQQQVESFLREYNTRVIHLLSIHEAMPGHYLEGAHSARHPSTLRAVLRSGPFVEGWGVYVEAMMIEAGYRADDPLMALAYRKWRLRGIANAILDQAVHVDGISREDAMKLMTVTTFQQEREAAGKWVRAQLSAAQLPTYFVGSQEHFDMRKAVEARDGDKFDLKAYHDKVLSYGAPPVRFVRELMLEEPIK